MHSHNVLIVDDAAETRIFLKSLVNSLGFFPYEAKNGAEALKIINESKIDLIILDILMPNMDGYQFLEAITSLKNTKKFKVAILTGLRSELDQQKLQILKPDDIIHKTVDILVLKTKLKKLITGHKTEKKTDSNTQISEITQTVQAREAEAQSAKIDQKENFTGSVTNLPIYLNVDITFITMANLTFLSPVQFKIGSTVSIQSKTGNQLLNKVSDIKCIVKKCTLVDNVFSTECAIDIG